ncbi:uncharacterized protein LOC110859136 isoform X2 [Folsomia candida]|uniref:uncharacterized protein LOC110859136 isoform X2 n=1 Tax=Folsomia candida TaxID=158441 RepID=UPI0016053954|nr:uncharacterized protein LOC110859136 isoform X2 [Folsomia candida]
MASYKRESFLLQTYIQLFQVIQVIQVRKVIIQLDIIPRFSKNIHTYIILKPFDMAVKNLPVVKIVLVLAALLALVSGTVEHNKDQNEFKVIAQLGAKVFYTHVSDINGTWIRNNNFCFRNNLFTPTISSEFELTALNNYFQPLFGTFPFWSGAVNFNRMGSPYWLRNYGTVQPGNWLTIGEQFDSGASCAYITNKTMGFAPCAETPFLYLCQNY